MSVSGREEQVCIGSGSGLYATLHRPARAESGAIVLCAPLFEERKSAGRTLVEMARSCCEAGLLAVRFDYRGCGDSQGEFSAFSVADWLEDVRTALRFAGQRTDKPVGVLGLRLGATLAALAPEASHPATFCVLWEPVTSGETYLRQELRKKLINEIVTFGKSRVTLTSLMRQLEGGAEIDFNGYTITPRLYRDLAGLALDGPCPPVAPACLWVGIGPRAAPAHGAAAIQVAWQERIEKVECHNLAAPPFWNLIGLSDCSALIDLTTAWIRDLDPAPRG